MQFHPLQDNIHVSKVHCRSAFEPGAPGLPYYCTPPLCVPDVLCALAVWRQNNQKKNRASWLWELVSPEIHAPPPTLWTVVPTCRGLTGSTLKSGQPRFSGTVSWVLSGWSRAHHPFKVAKGIVIFRTLSLDSISNKSISSLSFSCGHDPRHALWGVGTVNAGR